MYRKLPLLFILIPLCNFAQSLSKTHIIYESDDQVIMNNGKQYEILAATDVDKTLDTPTNQQHITVSNYTLSLNRILILKNNDELIKVVEWSNENAKFYEYPEIVDFEP
ncbi:hypothetical protein J8281_07280 [Aquimarina sp. U1-2]|uniref:hypothetical protein n=1 Tax=Aquimarina sp. U1-2 TaxID=2823141 RepID=UPI001AEC99E0|nr:hypothetical protein [Aquimarina sp. U1-2]MBP2831989.1 hypothetical protein [Aquimarina sp. U1-2]